MDRTTSLNYVIDGAGHRVFVDQNLLAGVNGTDVGAADVNALFEELMGIIEGAGLVGSSANLKQALAAIKLLIAQSFSSAFTLSGGGVSGDSGNSFWRVSADGFVEQGGYVNSPGADNVAVTFPIPFPSGQGPILTVTCANSVTTANGLGVYDVSATGFALSQTQPLSFFWEAKWH